MQNGRPLNGCGRFVFRRVTVAVVANHYRLTSSPA